MSNALNKTIDSTDINSAGLEVLSLDENASDDLSVMNKLEEFIENKDVSIALKQGRVVFNKDINSIKPENVEKLAKTQLANNVAIPRLTSQIGSLTIAFAMMLEQEMQHTTAAGRPKTVEEILLDNPSMKGSKQIMDILNFEKSDTSLVGGALYEGLSRLTDIYNSEVVKRNGAQRAVVAGGTAVALKSLGVSAPKAILGGCAINMLTELFTGNGKGYKKTSEKKTLAGKASQSVFDTGNLLMDSIGINSKTPFSLKGAQRGITSAFKNFTRGNTPAENAFAGVTLGLVGGLATWLGYKGLKKLGTNDEGETKSWKSYILPAIAGVSTLVGGAVLGKDEKEVSIENKGNVKNIISIEENSFNPVLDGVFTSLFDTGTGNIDKSNVGKLETFVKRQITQNNMGSQKEVVIKIGDKKTIKYSKNDKHYQILNKDFPNQKYEIRKGNSPDRVSLLSFTRTSSNLKWKKTSTTDIV